MTRTADGRHWKARRHRWALENTETGRLHGMNDYGDLVAFKTKREAAYFRKTFVRFPSRVVKIELQYAESR